MFYNDFLLFYCFKPFLFMHVFKIIIFFDKIRLPPGISARILQCLIDCHFQRYPIDGDKSISMLLNAHRITSHSSFQEGQHKVSRQIVFTAKNCQSCIQFIDNPPYSIENVRNSSMQPICINKSIIHYCISSVQ